MPARLNNARVPKASTSSTSCDSINNTFFTDFLMYREDQKELERIFKEDFQSDFNKYFDHLKEKYTTL